MNFWGYVVQGKCSAKMWAWVLRSRGEFSRLFSAKSLVTQSYAISAAMVCILADAIALYTGCGSSDARWLPGATGS